SVELFKTIARRWVGPRPRQAGGGFRKTPLAKFPLDLYYKNLPEASIHQNCVCLHCATPQAQSSCAGGRRIRARLSHRARRLEAWLLRSGARGARANANRRLRPMVCPRERSDVRLCANLSSVHSRASGNPVLAEIWVPAFAGTNGGIRGAFFCQKRGGAPACASGE